MEFPLISPNIRGMRELRENGGEGERERRVKGIGCLKRELCELWDFGFIWTHVD